jgi:nucleoid-associated protein YgaU
LAGGGYYGWKSGMFAAWKNSLAPVAQQTSEKIQSLFEKKEKPQEAENTDKNEGFVTLAQDTTANQIGESIFDQPRTYDIFLTMEVMSRGAMLTTLAEKHYGNRAFWVYIYEANRKTIANPDRLEEGTRIKIPKLPAELIDVNNPRTIEYARELEKKYKQ